MSSLNAIHNESLWLQFQTRHWNQWFVYIKHYFCLSPIPVFSVDCTFQSFQRELSLSRVTRVLFRWAWSTFFDTFNVYWPLSKLSQLFYFPFSYSKLELLFYFLSNQQSYISFHFFTVSGVQIQWHHPFPISSKFSLAVIHQFSLSQSHPFEAIWDRPYFFFGLAAIHPLLFLTYLFCLVWRL